MHRLAHFVVSSRSLTLLFFFRLTSVCCFDWVVPTSLSSRSLTLCDELSILLFIALSEVSVLVTEFSDFSRLLLMEPSSFLH